MRPCTIALVIFSLVACVAAPVSATERDEFAVRQASASFYDALNKLFEGDASPMTAVWSHADDVTYMGPTGGIQFGWNEVLETWESQAAKRLGGSVHPEQLHFNIGDDIAVVGCNEVGENIVDGKPQPVSIRATSIFRKENGEWKMIGHHTDLLPFLEPKG
jgi:ketosteroid isomerase-like protein